MDSNKKHNVSNIKGKDTSIELILRHALYKEGYRYRKNVKTLPGSPDIVLCKYKIAIFCDGDFFHGYDLTKTESLLKKNKDFWSNKIETNRKRDNKIDEELVSLGYIVLRYWEHEIKHDLDKVINDINLHVIQKEKAQ
ncbi:MAG: very short patch repair endonuclease [Bacilli bacterium]|nr:very short patch repair endonuclease [Bacilli bacterium]